MPQLHLPLFPNGATEITPYLSFCVNGEDVTYFHCDMPILTHAKTDRPSFLVAVAQLHVICGVKQAALARVFGIAPITVKRAVKLFREKGAPGFYAQRNYRGAAVLTEAVLTQAQSLLDEGHEPRIVAQTLGIKPNTLSKAIRAGKLHQPVKKSASPEDTGLSQILPASSKSERTSQDALALMGRGASNVMARVAASLGKLTAATPQFQPALDVRYGGVLTALPALLALGLLDCSEEALNQLPDGYYGLDSLLMLLCFMALGRLDTMESLRYEAPGEWGKLLGLDRAPEVSTLRAKVKLLSADGQAAKWSAKLCQRWMQDQPDQAGVLYVDGHTRVYHGHQTKLPKHYVARQKLCLRATVDYWVNATDGAPFFAINKVVDPGLIKTLEEDIVPRLENDIPHQPDEAALAADPHLHRFTLVYDREGYSPDMMLRLKAKRIACLSYHKFPGENWAHAEFTEQEMVLANGGRVKMKLAERGTRLSNNLWVREVRKWTDTGHQVALITTDYRTNLLRLSAQLLARWSQENYFKYAREHFGLDRLAGYSTEEITEPISVVNPAYRQLEGKIRSANGKLARATAEFGALSMEVAIEPDNVEAYMLNKAALQEKIESLKLVVTELKAKRKETPRHIDVKDLPEDQRFAKLSTHSKHFIDAIKMISYRAETAMANVLRDSLTRPDEARALLRALYATETDLLPDGDNNTLTVRLHHLAQNVSDQSVVLLCDELNKTETVFPRTNLRMIFELGTSKLSADLA
jgi:hypothetical protein